MNDNLLFQEVFDDLLIQYDLGLFDYYDFVLVKLSFPLKYLVRGVHYINFNAL